MLDMMPQREGGRKTGFNITVKKLMAKIEILIQFNLKCHCDEKSLKGTTQHFQTSLNGAFRFLNKLFCFRDIKVFRNMQIRYL